MANNIREELTPILAAIQIVSPASFLFCEKPVPVAPITSPTMPGFPNHPLPAMPLVRQLQMTLYTTCYARRFNRQQAEPDTNTTIGTDPAFVQQLSQNNNTAMRWEGGWTIYSVLAGGQVLLVKGDRQRSAMPGEFVTAGPPGMPPQMGASVNVQVLRESTAAQPGFYFAYGDTLSDIWDEHNLLRFYFHAPAPLAPPLLGYLTQSFNRYQIAFRLKALDAPHMYGRTDAVVLYVAKRYYEIALRLIARMPFTLAAGLEPSVPLFARMVQPGVGMAEDPNNGESFGMNRCRMVAEGIVDAWSQGKESVEDRLTAIASRFAQTGFNLDLPHLSPTSMDFAETQEHVEFAYA